MRVRGQFIRNLRLTFQNLALSPRPAGAAQAKERSRMVEAKGDRPAEIPTQVPDFRQVPHF